MSTDIIVSKCAEICNTDSGNRFSECEIPAIHSRVGRLLTWSPRLPYKSKSAWARAERKVLPGIEPIGFIPTNFAKISLFCTCYSAVIEDLGNDHYRVVLDGYHVYSYEQTTAKRQRKSPSSTENPTITCSHSDNRSHSSSTCSLSSFLFSSSSLPSYDSGAHVNTASNSHNSNKIDAVNNDVEHFPVLRNLNNGKRGPIETREVYFPVGFDWKNYPRLAKHKAAVAYILHLLHLRRVIFDDGKDAYIQLKMAHLKAIIPEASEVVRLLIDMEILERDGHYEPGSKSYGYRLVAPELRNASRKRIPLEDARLTKRLADHRRKEVKATVHRWLREQLYRLSLAEIDEELLRQAARLSVLEKGNGTVEDKVKAYSYALEMIHDGYYHATVDDFGRFHTNVTNLKREFRAVLRVSGRPLLELDIKSSQLLFLGLEIEKEGWECGDYLDRCQDDVYRFIAAKAKVTRGEVKKAITQRALFSPNDNRCQKTKIKRTFNQLFPEVAAYIYQAKAVKDGHRLLAQRLQKAESDFIIKTVCDRIRREKQASFITTIHDSLLFLEKDSEYVKTVVADEFAKLGVKPRLEVKELCRLTAPSSKSSTADTSPNESNITGTT